MQNPAKKSISYESKVSHDNVNPGGWSVIFWKSETNQNKSANSLESNTCLHSLDFSAPSGRWWFFIVTQVVLGRIQSLRALPDGSRRHAPVAISCPLAVQTIRSPCTDWPTVSVQVSCTTICHTSESGSPRLAHTSLAVTSGHCFPQRKTVQTSNVLIARQMLSLILVRKISYTIFAYGIVRILFWIS